MLAAEKAADASVTLPPDLASQAYKFSLSSHTDCRSPLAKLLWDVTIK